MRSPGGDEQQLPGSTERHSSRRKLQGRLRGYFSMPGQMRARRLCIRADLPPTVCNSTVWPQLPPAASAPLQLPPWTTGRRHPPTTCLLCPVSRHPAGQSTWHSISCSSAGSVCMFSAASSAGCNAQHHQLNHRQHLHGLCSLQPAATHGQRCWGHVTQDCSRQHTP